jgi:hypothetical protein
MLCFSGEYEGSGAARVRSVIGSISVEHMKKG